MGNTVACKRCGEQVEQMTKACPQCGVANPGMRIKDLIIGFVALGVLGWLALTLLGWIGDASSDAPAAGTQAGQSDPAPKAQLVRTLTVTPQQYVDRLNMVLTSAELPFRAQAGEINNGFMQSLLSDHLLLMARVDDSSGHLNEVTLIAQGDGTIASGLNVMLVGAAVITAAIPDAKMDDGVGKLVLDMVSEATNGDGAAKRLRNGTRISVSRSDQIGFMFTASPASD